MATSYTWSYFIFFITWNFPLLGNLRLYLFAPNSEAMNIIPPFARRVGTAVTQHLPGTWHWDKHCAGVSQHVGGKKQALHPQTGAWGRAGPARPWDQRPARLTSRVANQWLNTRFAYSSSNRKHLPHLLLLQILITRYWRSTSQLST